MYATVLVKSPDWKYEKEWRLIVTCFLPHNDEAYIDTDYPQLYKLHDQIIPFPYVKKVYLGPKMKENVKKHIREIARRLKIEVVELSLSETEFKLIEG